MADLDDVRSIASAFRNGLDAQGNFMESEDGPHLSTELEPPVEVEQINNQETLGISTRLKDLLLIGGSTALTGYLVFRTVESNNPLSLLKVVLPIHAVMLYGVSSSYLATRRLALAFTATGVAISAGLTAGISYLLTPNTENYTVLFKSLGWFVENIVVKRAASNIMGADVEIAAPADSAEEKLAIWIRTITSVAVTSLTGLIGMSGEFYCLDEKQPSMKWAVMLVSVRALSTLNVT